MYEYTSSIPIFHSFEGPLSSPENVTIHIQNSTASQLQWKPPYYKLNHESYIIHVDPHVTQYTVYTVNAYTRKIIEQENTTGMKFTFRNIPHYDQCCMYRISAWNAGGEGKLSEPVQESTPQGKHTS